MKKYLLKRLIIGIFLTLSVAQYGNAQIKDIGKFMLNGKTDGEQLLKGYLSPYANALGANLNGGWYNTAYVHKPGGFDLTFTLNMAFVPESDKSFDLNEIGMSEDALFPNGTIAPTIAGEKQSGPEVRYNVPGTEQKLISYNTPKGTNVNFVPAPMIQLGIGLFKGTEIMGRYLPTFDIGNTGSSVGLWGIGLKHSIKQYFPGIKSSPIFNLSFLGGFTQLKTSSELSILPKNITGAVDQTTSDVDFENQKMELDVKGYTFNIITSVNFPVVSFYGGVGISITNMEVALKGNYPTPYYDMSLNQTVIRNADVLVDPFSLKIKNTDGSTTNPRLNVGMRLKFGPITFHGDYTYASYSVVTAGLGLSIR